MELPESQTGREGDTGIQYEIWNRYGEQSCKFRRGHLTGRTSETMVVLAASVISKSGKGAPLELQELSRSAINLEPVATTTQHWFRVNTWT